MAPQNASGTAELRRRGGNGVSLRADTTHDWVVLVDKLDRELGVMPKLDAHRLGRCHRALSVIVRNSQGKLLLQQRAACKYHSAGLWTNTCCSHPRSGEEVGRAAARRLMEEMGIAAELTPLFSLYYRARVSEQLIEHEFLHVYGGVSDEVPHPNASEVGGWRWVTLADVTLDVRIRPRAYTCWFGKILRDFAQELAGFASA
ncbi:MAG TPA: isopentenyl-diphosphate Delta-isomerase [Xanthobacteraceae bacterium]